MSGLPTASTLPPGYETWPFGIAPTVHAKLVRLFESTPGVEGVWVFGSRARGDQRLASDIDLAVDMPEGGDAAFYSLAGAIDALDSIYRIDVVHWQAVHDDDFRARIERDRKVFWAPGMATPQRAAGASARSVMSRAPLNEAP